MQKDRLEAIDQLKSFKCRILITTDLVSLMHHYFSFFCLNSRFYG